MQTVTNYYYDNTIEVQFDFDNTCLVPDIPQKDRVVYTRPIQVYKGVTNILKVEIKNADQKPVDVTGHTLTFNVVEEYVFANANVVLTANVEPINFANGTGYVALAALDLVQLSDERYNYNVKISTCWGNVASYVDDNYGASGQLILVDSAYPVYPPNNLDLGNIGDTTVSAMYDFGNI